MSKEKVMITKKDLDLLLRALDYICINESPNRSGIVFSSEAQNTLFQVLTEYLEEEDFYKEDDELFDTISVYIQNEVSRSLSTVSLKDAYDYLYDTKVEHFEEAVRSGYIHVMDIATYYLIDETMCLAESVFNIANEFIEEQSFEIPEEFI